MFCQSYLCSLIPILTIGSAVVLNFNNTFEDLDSCVTGFFIVTAGLDRAVRWIFWWVPRWTQRRFRSEVTDGGHHTEETDNHSSKLYFHCSWKFAVCRRRFSGKTGTVLGMYLFGRGQPLKDSVSFSYEWIYKSQGHLSYSENSFRRGGSLLANSYKFSLCKTNGSKEIQRGFGWQRKSQRGGFGGRGPSDTTSPRKDE